ncbi:segregation and condensation protein A [Peptostreptococcus equinus]|uniref:Segregation and condensation protein A n=1 Tax=Peptostreptococcus equinus TaxID=3003601 RepID=A0ABY7JL06_9FIRM|nr:segregation/condensation protein A [Peptostreptococcus sp. CBA3647]WAW14036.1 segregation/condensation protein A [Peptostreptococcus sp. CBA3647]
MDYSLQLNKYEGPMDLLFDLINKNQIDIKDISMVEITDQYVEYVNTMKNFDLNFASDFIAMASKLLEIKSRYILYMKNRDSENQVEDPRLELVQKIEEYKKYRMLSDLLEEKLSYMDHRFYREQEITYLEDEDKDLDYDLSKVNIEEIENILPYILKSMEKSINQHSNVKIEKKLEEIVKNKIIPVEGKIEEIRKKLAKNSSFTFDKFVKNSSKNEIIAEFLALLELIKLKEIIINQDKFCDEIIVKRKAGSIHEEK